MEKVLLRCLFFFSQPLEQQRLSLTFAITFKIISKYFLFDLEALLTRARVYISGKKCHIFVHLENGQFSDKNVIWVEMSTRIAKIPKIPRVSIYMATFEPKLVETFWFLLPISIQQNQLVFWKIWTKISTFFPLWRIVTST